MVISLIGKMVGNKLKYFFNKTVSAGKNSNIFFNLAKKINKGKKHRIPWIRRRITSLILVILLQVSKVNFIFIIFFRI